MTTQWDYSSSTDATKRYRVSQLPSGALTCTCAGFSFRRDCWHTKDVQAKLPKTASRSQELLAAALNYCRLGYHVIPVEPRGKRPLVAWKDFQTVKPTERQITAWWARTPEANVGLVITGDRLVVDLDGGPDAEALLAAKGITLPADAPRSRTRSGFHVFLRAPRAMPDRIGLLKATEALPEESLTPGGKPRHAQIDIRGLGIIIAAPSVHPTGAIYTWLAPLTETLPPAPAALVDLVEHVMDVEVEPVDGVFRVFTTEPDGKRRLDLSLFTEIEAAGAHAEALRRGVKRPEYRARRAS